LGEALGASVRDTFYDAAAVQSLMAPAPERNFLMNWLRVSRWPAYISETLFAQIIIGYVSGLGNTAPAGIGQFQAGLELLRPASPTDDATALAEAQAAAANPGATASSVVAATTAATAAPTYIATIVEAAAKLPGANTQTVVNAALYAAANMADVQQFASLLLPLYQHAVSAATAPEQSQQLQKNVEAWFHEFGERMTGWYKRDNRKWLFVAGLLVAMLADVDTVRLARFLSDSANANARAALVTAGVAAAKQAAPLGLGYNPANLTEADKQQQAKRVARADSVLLQGYTKLKETLDAVPLAGLPLGLGRWWDWETRRTKHPCRELPKLLGPAAQHKFCLTASPTDSVWVYEWAPTADDYHLPAYAQRWRLNPYNGSSVPAAGTWTWLFMAGGWLLTAFALMLGAPFWFDTLSRFVNIRNVGIKPAAAAGNR
jgi:hypothetical protein